MLLFSNGYHAMGLYYSAPRRTMLGATPYFDPRWQPFLYESLVGVTLLAISGAALLRDHDRHADERRRARREMEMPIAEPAEPGPMPVWLDRWAPWMWGAVALVVLSYGPMLLPVDPRHPAPRPAGYPLLRVGQSVISKA